MDRTCEKMDCNWIGLAEKWIVTESDLRKMDCNWIGLAAASKGGGEKRWWRAEAVAIPRKGRCKGRGGQPVGAWAESAMVDGGSARDGVADGGRWRLRWWTMDSGR
ncbi:hypothetical protein U1Q18_016114 [Sarracenia purpurea var. burkii]